jgi:hypothetical protein
LNLLQISEITKTNFTFLYFLKIVNLVHGV